MAPILCFQPMNFRSAITPSVWVVIPIADFELES